MRHPSSGHIFWHLFSSYALFVWWLTYRVRPGDPPTPYSADRELIMLVLLIGVKNGVRRLVMNVRLPCYRSGLGSGLGSGVGGVVKSGSGTALASGSGAVTVGISGGGASGPRVNEEELKARLLILGEHVLFAVWAYSVVVMDPLGDGGGAGGSGSSSGSGGRSGSGGAKGGSGSGSGSDNTLFGFQRFLLSDTQSQSWLLNTKLCWSEPAFPSEAFHLFYAAKCATHAEDLIFMGIQAWLAYIRRAKVEGEGGAEGEKQVLLQQQQQQQARVESGEGSKVNGTGGLSGSGDSLQDSRLEGDSAKKPPRDVAMTLHHIATAALCLQSYALGYVKIGSIIMFLHDVSDIPLDFLRVFTALNLPTKLPLVVSYLALLVGWIYWRLWFFPTRVLYSIAVESKSLLLANEGCEIGSCTWSQVPERFPFLALLGVLQLLHVVWFVAMLRKGYVELVEKR